MTDPALPTALPAAVPPGAPVLVGLSGGLDSTVLLHWLGQQPAIRAAGLSAVHVHHGLQADAGHWAEHCRQLCRQLDIALQVVHVQVIANGHGPEAAARDARRAAFAARLQPGQWLALAHHRDDQAETFLLRALRASGVDGLAAMRTHSRLGNAVLWRPLLQQPRSALLQHASTHGLAWIEDPSNQSEAFDRNFLRAQVLPLLRQRWPQADAALAASAARCAQDAQVLDGHDQTRLDSLGDAAGSLSVAGLRACTAPVRARLLRLWLRQHGAPPLPGHLHAVLDAQVLASGHDRAAQLAWRHWLLQHWCGRLYLRQALPATGSDWQLDWDGRAPLRLPDGGVLSLHGSGSGFVRPLQVRPRRGGERIALPGRQHQHALKDCLQRARLPPWQRLQLPLLHDGAIVLAAGDVVLAAGLGAVLADPGDRLHWQRPGTGN